MSADSNQKPGGNSLPIGLVMMCLVIIAFFAMIIVIVVFCDNHWFVISYWIENTVPIVFFVFCGFLLLGGIFLFASTRDLNFVTPFNRVAWYRKKKKKAKEKIREGHSDDELEPCDLQTLQLAENYYNDKIASLYKKKPSLIERFRGGRK